MFKDTNEFFDEVSKGRLTDIDVYNYVSLITDDFKINKLRVLLGSIDFYIGGCRAFLENEFEGIQSYLLDGDTSKKDGDNVYKYGTISETNMLPSIITMYDSDTNLKDLKEIYIMTELEHIDQFYNAVKSRIEQQSKEIAKPILKNLSTSNNLKFLITNKFFEEVASGGVSKIDIENYVCSITNNNEKKKLQTVLKDIEHFIIGFENSFYNSISEEMKAKKVKFLIENGEEIPIKKNFFSKFYKKEVADLIKLENREFEKNKVYNYVEIFAIDLKLEKKPILSLKSYIISLIEENNPPTQTLQLEVVLKEMFPDAISKQLELLQVNLKGGSEYVELKFIGPKNKLWKKLGEVYSCGIKRGDILSVFSKYVVWQQYNVTPSKPLTSIEINKKLPSKTG